MYTRKTILATSMLALGLLGQSALSQASNSDYSQQSDQPPGGAADRAHMRGGSPLADRLNLSEAQRQSMKTISEKYRPELHDLRQKMRDTHAALAKADLTDARVQELATAQCKVSTRMIVLRRNMRLEMDKILTDEQRQKLKAMLEHRHDRHHDHDEMAPF